MGSRYRGDTDLKFINTTVTSCGVEKLRNIGFDSARPDIIKCFRFRNFELETRNLKLFVQLYQSPPPYFRRDLVRGAFLYS